MRKTTATLRIALCKSLRGAVEQLKTFFLIFSALKIFAAKMLTFGYQYDPLFRMTKLYQLQEKHIKHGLMKMANGMIRAKEKSLGENPEEEEESGKPQLFVNQLFKMRDSFSTEEISDEINTVILAVSHVLSSISEFSLRIFSLSGLRDREQRFVSTHTTCGVSSRSSE
jgi:hypothetical protein